MSTVTDGLGRTQSHRACIDHTHRATRSGLTGDVQGRSIESRNGRCGNVYGSLTKAGNRQLTDRSLRATTFRTAVQHVSFRAVRTEIGCYGVIVSSGDGYSCWRGCAQIDVVGSVAVIVREDQELL